MGKVAYISGKNRIGSLNWLIQAQEHPIPSAPAHASKSSVALEMSLNIDFEPNPSERAMQVASKSASEPRFSKVTR